MRDEEEEALADAHRELDAIKSGSKPKEANTSTPRKSAPTDHDSDSSRCVYRIDLGMV